MTVTVQYFTNGESWEPSLDSAERGFDAESVGHSLAEIVEAIAADLNGATDPTAVRIVDDRTGQIMAMAVTVDQQTVVANGAAFLDKLEPGWHHHINLNKLDLGDSYNCVLGQLAARIVATVNINVGKNADPLSYFGVVEGLADLGYVPQDMYTWAILHGFLALKRHNAALTLTTLWRDLIAARKANRGKE